MTTSGQKGDSWSALACEQTGLLGHRCQKENTGLKARRKHRPLMFREFCETGISHKTAKRCCRLRDSPWSACRGQGRRAALGLQGIAQLPAGGGWLKPSGRGFSSSVLSTQAASSRLALGSFTGPTRVKAQEGSTNLHLLSSHCFSSEEDP